MVVVRIKGGLGNQLFQYAAAYSLAQRLKTKLKLDTTFYARQTLRSFKLDKLSIEYSETVPPNKIIELFKNKYLNKALRIMNVPLIPVGKNAIYILETCSDMMDILFTETSENIYLDGYYQSEKYFSEYREEILRQFEPNYPVEEECAKAISEVSSTNSVGIHVRRGDFFSSPAHYVLGEKYYNNALEYISRKLQGEVMYYWFSDDMEWVKKCFGEKANYRFISLHTKNHDIDEMQVMAHCRHIIAANSTFSWWSAFANQGGGIK